MSRQRIASRVDLLTVPLDPDETAGWKPYYQYQGPTHNADFLSCHASVLVPGHCPHPPHSHPEEEILLMLAGEADLILPSLRSDAGEPQPLRLRPGQFVYYPAHFHHTLRTVSAEPANYVMFKWRARARRSRAQLSFGQFDAGDACFPGKSAAAFDYRLLFEGPTTCLELLHAHASRLAAGAGNPPHSHSYEMAMVVLEGEIEILGHRVPPHGLVFCSGGTPHGIRNPTPEPARYVVFEFHGHVPLWRKMIDAHRWRHRLRAMWNGDSRSR